jgi:hypothetical protein
MISGVYAVHTSGTKSHAKQERKSRILHSCNIEIKEALEPALVPFSLESGGGHKLIFVVYLIKCRLA